ncbi:MAG TPA: hypothetical protein VJC39_03530 [Candidatus Nanoarchaeia archaeon]|nr:hypothetical protein [Candidatus Nanoarchaeia archaeon]
MIDFDDLKLGGLTFEQISDLRKVSIACVIYFSQAQICRHYLLLDQDNSWSNLEQAIDRQLKFYDRAKSRIRDYRVKYGEDEYICKLDDSVK